MSWYRTATLFLLLVGRCTLAQGLGEEAGSAAADPTIVEVFPILSYDTDAGFGYGGKVVLRNQLGWRESFDVTLFNSTKGERWYRFGVSVPDAELRQGSAFPLAMDLVVDYDKWISNSFFGVGMGSSFDARELYTKEPLELSLAFSCGFSSTVVAAAGFRFKAVRNFGFTESGTLQTLPTELNPPRAAYASGFVQLRFDSRDSFINPSSGSVVQLEFERAPASGWGNVQFSRYAGTFQYYRPVFARGLVLALRTTTMVLEGDALPVQVLLPVGGNSTLRGSPQDRYLDRVAAVANAEFRLPLYRRFGGVAAIDAGRVFHTLSEFDLTRWTVNPTAGLRLAMETFVVRLDVGFGKETTGFYLNFGQIF